MTYVPTIGDGQDITQGSKSDAAITDPASTTATAQALRKGILSVLKGQLNVQGVYTADGVGPLTDGDLKQLQLSPSGSLLTTLVDLLSASAGDSINAYLVANSSVLSIGNSTTVTLTGSASAPANLFPGAAESTAGMDLISASVFADTPGTLSIQQSPDNTHWDTSESYAYQPNAASDKSYFAQVKHPWFRVQYSNGVTGQGTMRLQTQLCPVATRMANARTNAQRLAPVVHRNAITANDKAGGIAASAVTATVLAGGGSLPIATHNWAVIPGNKYGTVGLSLAAGGSVGSTAIAAVNGAIRLAFTPTLLLAEYFDIFMGQDAAPRLVGRVTLAQVQTGVVITVAATASAAATVTTPSGTSNSVEVRVAANGTAQQTSAQNFAQSNAYTPDTVASVGFVPCAGYSLAHVQITATLTDLFTAPTLNVIPFLYNDVDSLYHQGQAATMAMMTNVAQSLRQDMYIPVDGASRMVICFGGMAGKGLAVTATVQLS